MTNICEYSCLVEESGLNPEHPQYNYFFNKPHTSNIRIFINTYTYSYVINYALETTVEVSIPMTCFLFAFLILEWSEVNLNRAVPMHYWVHNEDNLKKCFRSFEFNVTWEFSTNRTLIFGDQRREKE